MIKTHVKILALLSTIFALISCNSGPMKNVDFDSPGNKMYFIEFASLMELRRPCDFIKKYRNFYIDDRVLLATFKNELIKERIPNSKNIGCNYVIQLQNNHEIKFAAFLDLEDKQLRGNKSYNFDLDGFETYNEKFKKLEAFEVNFFYSLKDIGELISDFENAGGYVYGITGAKENRFRDKKGMIKLLIDPSYLDQNGEFEKVKKQILDDFDPIEEISIQNYYSNNDSIKVDIFCKSDISRDLPPGYRIMEPYTDSIDETLLVYDLPRNLIDSIFEIRNINKREINDLNDNKTTGNTR